MRFHTLLTAVSLLVVTISCQSLLNPGGNDPVLVTYDNNPLKASQIREEIRKNSPVLLENDTVSTEQVKDFLERFVEYRLKVDEGYRNGYDKDSSLISEFQTYKRQLAQSRVYEGEIKQALVEEMYNRMKTEVNASHLLIRTDTPPIAGITKTPKQRMDQIVSEIKNGKPFEQAVMEYSEDPSKAQNQGNLGWFTGGDMVYPFENAVYTAPIDSVVGPVKTRFGYHLIKVSSRRPAANPRYVSHIMFMLPIYKYQQSQMRKLDSIRTLIINGEDFREMAVQFSEDLQTKNNGGYLGKWRQTGQVPEFDTMIFDSLQSNGALSPVVKTKWGYHLIRLDSIGTFPSLESQKQSLLQKVVAQTDRMEAQKLKLFEELKTRHQIKINTKTMDTLLSVAMSILNDSLTYRPSIKEAALPIRSMTVATNNAGFSLTVGNVVDYAFENNFDVQLSGAVSVSELLDQTVGKAYIESYIDRLDSYDAEFANTIRYFKDGLVLFKWMEKKIWTTPEPNDTTLMAIFESNKMDFNWDERKEFLILKVNNKEKADSLLKANRDNDVSILLSAFKKEGVFAGLDTVIAEKYSNNALTPYWDREENVIPSETDRYYSAPVVMIVSGTLPPSPKTFEESQSDLLRIYNDQTVKANEEREIKALFEGKEIIYNEAAIQAFASGLPN